MKVLLHDAQQGVYYRESADWTRAREEALDLRQTAAAARIATDLRLQRAEVVLCYDDHSQDVFLPLELK